MAGQGAARPARKLVLWPIDPTNAVGTGAPGVAATETTMFLSRTWSLLSVGTVSALVVTIAGSASAQAPTRGYAYQESLRGKRTAPATAARPAPASPALVQTLPPAGTAVAGRPAPVSPVTVPSAPAVTGDAAAAPQAKVVTNAHPPGTIVIWYEARPNGRWVECRGTVVAPPSK
jgi:hypothetical protein